MSWDFDQQFLDRLMAPLVGASSGTLTPIPKDSLLHGTTIGALVVENGQRAVAFSDGKVSMGNDPVHLAYRKMTRIDKRSVLLFSGSPSLAVKYGRVLRNWIGYREETTNEPMTARGKDFALQDILLQGINLAGAGIMLAPILVTYDTHKGRVRLFNYGPEGSRTEHDDFITSGSGRPSRLILDGQWKPGLTLPEGIGMARKLIEGIYKVDSFSGGKFSYDVVGPDGVETGE